MLNALLRALIQTIDLLLSLYVWLIIARAIISWVNPNPYHPVVRFLYQTTEPVLRIARRVIPPIYGLDLSPVAVIFLIYLIRELLLYIRFNLY